MRIAICDDLTEYRRSVKCYTAEYFKLRHIDFHIDEFETGSDLLRADEIYDILFLDIELNDLNGITVAKEIQKKHKNTVILIVTAYHQYLDDAMDIHVTRYIDKPVTQKRIFSALDKALTVLNESVITLHTKGNQVVRLKVSDIIYAEAKLKGVFVYTQETSYRIKETMKELRLMLTASCFAVPHNSYIVNMNYIGVFKRNEITLIKPYETIKISIATRKQAEFKRRFFDFIDEDIVND
mgnify:FL=1